MVVEVVVLLWANWNNARIFKGFYSLLRSFVMWFRRLPLIFPGGDGRKRKKDERGVEDAKVCGRGPLPRLRQVSEKGCSHRQKMLNRDNKESNSAPLPPCLFFNKQQKMQSPNFNSSLLLSSSIHLQWESEWFMCTTQSNVFGTCLSEAPLFSVQSSPRSAIKRHNEYSHVGVNCNSFTCATSSAL